MVPAPRSHQSRRHVIHGIHGIHGIHVSARRATGVAEEHYHLRQGSPSQDPFEQLAAAAGAEPLLLKVAPTPLGRGLVLKGQEEDGDLGASSATSKTYARSILLSIPLHNALVITDDPLGGISSFGDACHRAFQVLLWRSCWRRAWHRLRICFPGSMCSPALNLERTKSFMSFHPDADPGKRLMNSCLLTEGGTWSHTTKTA